MAHSGKKVYAGRKLVGKRIDRAVARAQKAATNPKKTIAQLLREARFYKLYQEQQADRLAASRLEAERNVKALEKSMDQGRTTHIVRGTSFLQNVMRNAETGRSRVEELTREARQTNEPAQLVCRRCNGPVDDIPGVWVALCIGCMQAICDSIGDLNLTPRGRGTGR